MYNNHLKMCVKALKTINKKATHYPSNIWADSIKNYLK